VSGSKKAEPKALLKVVNDALRLLEHTVDLPSGEPVLAEPLPGLYQQCLELNQSIQQRTPEPIRTVHHFACTGGTLMCKYLAATPNTRLLSEVDPLSPLSKPYFSPTDLIKQYRHSIRPVQDSVLWDVFLAGLAKIYEQATYQGERLVLRDHTHSHFCTGAEIADRDTLRIVLAENFSVKSVVMVRHPLDSFLSLKVNNWVHFTPSTIEDYAQRYLAFLDAYEGVPIVKYEDFVTDTEGTLQILCDLLDLAYVPNLGLLTQIVVLTGDSGRGSSSVEARARREEPPEVTEARTSSEAFQTLCKRLGYDPS
jgi:hypothetical protein